VPAIACHDALQRALANACLFAHQDVAIQRAKRMTQDSPAIASATKPLSPVFAEYHRLIGISYVMALPLRIDDANVISVVFNRSNLNFTDAERASRFAPS
jgi:hypothetical protein